MPHRKTMKARRVKRAGSRRQRGGGFISAWFQSFWPPEDIISADVKNFKEIVEELIEETIVKIRDVLTRPYQSILERKELYRDFKILIRLLHTKIREINEMIDEYPDDRDVLEDVRRDVHNLLYTKRNYGYKPREHSNEDSTISLVDLTQELALPARELRRRHGTNGPKFKVWA